MNDILYILGKNSCWQDNELRYSLRSVEKYLQNYRKVVIVGECPSWINKACVLHLPCDDEPINKAANIKKKILLAAHSPEVSENFMFFNDDYFLTAKVDANDYPYYWKCDLGHTEAINHTIYRQHVMATIQALRAKNHPLKNFDTHKPIIYNKERLKEVIYSYDWSVAYGYVMRSLYCNTLNINGEHKLDNKLVRPMRIDAWKEMIVGIDCFSVDDRAVDFIFKDFIGKMFPDKSVFEL